MYGSAIFVPYLRNQSLPNLVFAAPDVGGVGRARGFAKYFAAEMVVCDKHRKRANEVASMQVIGDVEGADVVLVDDMIDTAGTICKAAQIIKEKRGQFCQGHMYAPYLVRKCLREFRKLRIGRNRGYRYHSFTKNNIKD